MTTDFMSTETFRSRTKTVKASEILRMLRCRRGWNQSQLAELIGVHPITVSNWERGVTRPHPGHLGRIYEIFGIDPVLFLQEEAERQSK